jgi:PleD family two-component response regulator
MVLDTIRKSTMTDQRIPIRSSGGLSLGVLGDDPRTLVTQADTLLYHAKTQRKDQICIQFGENPVLTVGA